MTSVTIDTNRFWSLLTESQLVPRDQIQSLFSEFSGNSTISNSVEGLAQWLVQSKAISEYQAKVLLAGQNGPFRFGGYTVFGLLQSGPLAGSFLARHAQTGFPVLLQFLPGTDSTDLTSWDRIETEVEKVVNVEHPNLTEVYEAVVLPDHRFVVSQFPHGSTLALKLPPKSRLPWQKACELVAQVTRGLAQLHQSGIVHQSISLDKVWLEKSGPVQLRFCPLDDHPNGPDSSNGNSRESGVPTEYCAPEAMGDHAQITTASDIYSIGCLMVRILSGRPPFSESDPVKLKQLHLLQPPPELTKYDLPSELDALIQKMMAKDPSDRPSSAAEISTVLALYSGVSEKINSVTLPVVESRIAYRKSLFQFMPTRESGAEHAFPVVVGEGGANETVSARSAFHDASDSSDMSARIQSASETARRRRKNIWMAPMVISVSLFAIVALGSVWMLRKTPTTADSNPRDGHNRVLDDTTDDAAPEIPTKSTEPTPALVQQLIDDDNQTLWESPTTGPPIEFSFLPPSPRLLFTFRVSELIKQPEGQRLIKSLGARFETMLEQLASESGVTLEEIDQLVVSLHSNTDFQYDPFFVIRTRRPVNADILLQRWDHPLLTEMENGQEIYESPDGDNAYFLLPVEPEHRVISDARPADGVSWFAFGKKELVRQVAIEGKGSPLSGSLRNLSGWTDRDRHMNFLFLRNALFNDEGQHWMGTSLKRLNRELSIFIPDEVRGGLVSFHIDSGNYFEIMLDKSLDLKPADLRQLMQDEVKNQRERLTQFVAGIPSGPYWDKVRLRYDNMLSDVSRQLRWSVERGEVVANGWLPPMAAHNLIAASELVISFSSGAGAPAVAIDLGPRTLAELLATKRDLNIANPPDLNVLLLNLQNEINDDFRKLPFVFNIRLIGADLQKEGITKNQRPNELVMTQKTLAEILTAIMTGANPSKDITGPEDPNCKLIWVVADDPENPGEKAVLITTRAAAAEKSYELPPVFRTE